MGQYLKKSGKTHKKLSFSDVVLKIGIIMEIWWKVYCAIPIIALSAVAMKHDIEKFEGLFDAYITKPVDFTVLMEEVDRQLGKHDGK